MASRRSNAPRPRPQSLDSSASFHLSKFSQSGLNHRLMGNDVDFDVLGLMNRGCSFGMPQFVNYASHRQSLPNLDYTIPFGNGLAAYESEPHLLPTRYSESPPDMSASITPVEDCSRLDELMPVPEHWDQAAYENMLGMSGEPDFSTTFDMANILDFMGPQQVAPISSDFQDNAPKPVQHHFGSIEATLSSPRPEMSSTCPEGTMDIDSSENFASSRVGSEKADALLACQESWPFFCCNRVPSSGCFPPRTAAIYVEGLIGVLTTHDWRIPHRAQHTEAKFAARELLQEDEAMVSIIGHSAETLNAVIQTLLQKASTTHRTEQDTLHSNPKFATGDEKRTVVHMPPSDAINRFLESYITHHKPYYPCAADLTYSSMPILQSNIQASGLLMLLTIAQGAAFIATPAARYLASGLIEACRLFLFESIEKDILLSREPVVLQSALLFTTAAAWSGDNWHMDIAMGQRGMYLSMMSHARMFNGHEGCQTSDGLHQNREDAWQEWKALEEKRRIAYSWVILDQELSLFSDTAPLLNVVNLQAPMPNSDYLRSAQSADEWASRCREVLKNKPIDGPSLRDLFTSFVEGGLSSTAISLSPIQLRLLLHPLQTLVCQLRQFLTCLPDSGRQTIGTSISKVAIKARLEEISTLLRQWYGFTECHIAKEGKTCWTTRASLIMYHMISLNTRTSLGFIEQFARGEVQCASARHASQWLQTHCLDDSEEIFFHCGQIIRQIKSLPEALRPPWWSGAIYRAALIGWATSMASAGSRLPPDNTTEMDKPFAIDTIEPEHPSLQQYLRYKEGLPMLSRRDGQLVEMNFPNNILQHCISILEEDLSMKVTEGIMRKLQSLLDRWRNPPFEVKA